MPRSCVTALGAEHLQEQRHQTESHSHRSCWEQLGAFQLPQRARQPCGTGTSEGRDPGVAALHLLQTHSLKAFVFY